MRNVSMLANIMGILASTALLHAPKHVSEDPIKESPSDKDYEAINKAEAKRQRKMERSIKNASK